MDFNRFLDSQNLYLCRRKPKSYGPFLLKSVNKHLWLRMARMEMEYNLKNQGLTFQVVSSHLQKIDTFSLSLILDVQR